MTEQPVTLAQQATEAELAALEWAGWMRQITQSKDNRVDSSVERLASMSMRLKVKQAIAETMKELAERETRGGRLECPRLLQRDRPVCSGMAPQPYRRRPYRAGRCRRTINCRCST